RLDREAARRGRGEIPGEGERVQGRNGGARPLQVALPRLRLAGAAHPLRGQRGELLCDLSDRWTRARRSVVVTPAEGRLAAVARSVGNEARAMRFDIESVWTVP